MSVDSADHLNNAAQVLHGYRDGHQLLATSATFNDAEAEVLSHNSDSAPRSRTIGDPYLTGYPLGEKSYVIARTWRDEAAARPNTVITRSVILPRARLLRVGAPQLDALLRPPSNEELAGQISNLSLDALRSNPFWLTMSEARLASTFYTSRRRLGSASAYERDRVALAIWEQLWSPARDTLHFCTAPDTSRFANMKRPLLFENDIGEGVMSTKLSEVERLQADLRVAGPLRAFMKFVGSGEPSVDFAVPFDEAFGLLHEVDPDPEALLDFLRRFNAVEPRRLRRLKRRFMSFDGSRPRWAVEPFRMLEALAWSDLGQSIYKSDAALDRWIKLVWRTDADRTASLLLAAENRSQVVPAGPVSAAEGLAGAFASEASELISPSTLSIAFAVSPSAALKAVLAQNSVQIWSAWARLGPDAPVPGSVDSVSTLSEGDFDWSPAVTALRATAPWQLRRIVDRYGQVLEYLVRAVDSDPAPSDFELNLGESAREELCRLLETSEDHLIGLSRLADVRHLPKRLNDRRWIVALGVSDDQALHATAYLVARQDSNLYWRLFALSLCALYHQFAESEASEAWLRISATVPGDMNTWDRCGRLLDDYVRHLRSMDDGLKTKSLSFVQSQNATASSGIAHRLRPAPKSDSGKKKKKFNLFDPTTW